MAIVKDLTGQRFGRLLCKSQAGKNKRGDILWECVCDCGNTCFVASTSLKRGRTKSCGCLRNEYLHKPKVGKKTHGKTNSRLYAVWQWAMENGYDETAPQGKFTVDRINNDGNYEPSNCRLVDMKTQYHNRNLPKSIKEISEEHGLTYDAVHQRMKKGASIEDALKKPLRKKVKVLINGQHKTVKELSKESGVPESTIYYRVKIGLSGEDVIRV